MPSPRCPHGHLFTASNTYWATNGGRKPYRQCKACRAHFRRLKYRRDEAFRERERYRANVYNHSKRLAQAPVEHPQ